MVIGATVLSLLGVLAVSTFITTILVAMAKCPVWVPLILISVIELVRCFGVN